MKKEDLKPITWQQLKDFCNSLDESQLKNQVKLNQEESLISSLSCDVWGEDLYSHDILEGGCATLSEIKSYCESMDEEFLDSECVKVWDKNDPILFENF